MAKKNQLNVSVGVDTKGYKNSWEEAIAITQKSGNDIEKEAAKMALAVSKKLENMSVKSQARQLENLVVKMQEAGLAGTKAFSMAATSAGKLKAEIDDAKGIIAAMRPDAPFNALNTTLGAGAQAFAGVQGAMALFGAESENVQKTLLKVQAAMAFAEGFKALDGLSDGFQQLNLVINANPLIAGATVVAGVVAAMIALSDATETVSASQKLLNEVTDVGIKNAQKEYGEVEALKTIILDESAARELRTTALKELQDKYPDYLQNLSIETSSTKELRDATNELSQAIVKRATVQAAFDKLKEIGQKRLEVELAKAELEKDRLTAGGLDQSAFKKSLEGRANFVRATENLLNQQLSDLSNFIQAQDKLIVKSVIGDFAAPSPPPKQKDKEAPYKNPFKNLSTKGIESLGIKSDPNTIEEVFDRLPNKIKAVTHEFKEYNKQVLSMIELNESIAKSIQSLAVNSLQSFSMAIGEMIGGSETAMQDFGTQLLKAIAAFMQSVSQAMIATALASEVFQKTLFTNPAMALAAGIAVAVGAGVLKQTMSNGIEGKGFAEGGLIGGNSYSGDKLFAPVNSGEVILNTGQQNQLLRLANGTNGDGSLITKLSRNDLIIWLDKGGNDMRR